MITPTIGRVVWYYPPGKQHTDQAFPALIAYVWSDTMINVGGFDHNGVPFAATSVMLVQDETSYGNPGGGAWACWMPYQHSAAKSSPTTKHPNAAVTP